MEEERRKRAEMARKQATAVSVLNCLPWFLSLVHLSVLARCAGDVHVLGFSEFPV